MSKIIQLKLLGLSLLLGGSLFLTNQSVLAIGSDVRIGTLGAADNIYYGSATGGTGNLLLLQSPIGTSRFRVGVDGSIYIGTSVTPVCTSSGCTANGGTPNLNGWTFTDNYFYDDGDQVIGAYDEWLRLNNASNFTNGVYTPGLFRADGGIQVSSKTAISSDNYYHEAKSTVANRYGYFNVKNSLDVRGAYFGFGNGDTSVDLVLDNASLLNITGGNVTMSGNLTVSGASLTVAGKNVCLADGTNCLTATGDNLGNHTATQNLNFGDWQAQNVNTLQLKDLDDNTGGTDNKYRLLARDGAWMFHDGGVVIGSYINGTWTDVPDGQLIVENSVGIGTTNPGVYKLNVAGDVKISGDLDLANFDIARSSNIQTNQIYSTTYDNLHINNNLRIGGGSYIDNDATIGGASDDWIKISDGLEVHPMNTLGGLFVHDYSATSLADNKYIGISQIGTTSYLANSSSNAPLNYFIKADGRDVTFGGDVKITSGSIDLDKSYVRCSGTGSVTCACPAGKSLLYGGASCPSDLDRLLRNTPQYGNEYNAWIGYCRYQLADAPVDVIIVCANTK